MVNAKIRHRDHANATTFVDDYTINIRNHVGSAPLDIAEKLIGGPFGYEWAEPVQKFNPETWTKQNKALVWNTIMPYFEGYGYVAQMMIYGLKQLGVDVSVFYKSDYSYVKGEIMDTLFKPKRWDAWGIWHHFWQKPGMLPFEKKAIYTMWESTKFNEGWTEALNEVNMVFVPCQQNVDSFKNNGVTVPIKVVQHGVDQEHYFYRPKEKKDYFLIGTIGSLVLRKDPELLIQAFLDEFRNETDIKLYIKDTNEQTELSEKYGADKKIIFNGKKISPYEVGSLLGQFDISVFPSHGEGFGLGGLQSMACGTTCIITDWGGFREYRDDRYNYGIQNTLIDIDKVPSNNTTYSGQWAQANYEHLRSLLRYAYEHQDEIHEKGKAAAEWVKKEWTWARPASQLIAAIDEYEQLSS